LPDAGYPNYLVTLPDGSVQAQFPGGVAMVADSSPGYDYTNPTANKAVSWHRDTVSGAMVAGVSASVAQTGDVANADVVARTPAGDASAVLALQALNTTGPQSSVMAVVKAAAVQTTQKILGSDNSSDYARRAETQVLWAGPFNPKPANTNEPFTVPAPGNYTLIVSVSGVVTVTGFVKLVWSIDGVQVAFPALIFNQANVHMTFPVALGTVGLAAGAHNWSWTQVADGGPAITVNAGDSMNVLLVPSQ
jgi:hypothetical protein